MSDCPLRLVGAVLAAWLLGLLPGADAVRAATPNARPNIIFILADDLGIGDARCYNPASQIPTPHLDRLAAEGMRFTDAHSPSAVCTPTRYAILTGRYAWRSRLKEGVLWGYSRCLIGPEQPTIAKQLHQHGYRTACVGKWHLGFQSPAVAEDGLPDDSSDLTAEHPHAVDYASPLRPGPVTLGFDYYFGIPASLDMYPYLYVENDRPLVAPTDRLAPSQNRRAGGGGFWRGGPSAPGFHPVDVLPELGRRATDWIGAQSSDQPFFLYFPLSAPHKPWVPTDSFQGKSGAGWYGDFVAQVDAVVGQVLAALDQHGLAENTLILFTSDNGAQWTSADIKKYDHRANLDYRGQKADIWEGGHRVPLVARFPGVVEPGSRSDALVCLTDWMATAAALCGDEAATASDRTADSHNLLPILTGLPTHAWDAELRNRAVVHHSLNGTFAIRQGTLKLVVDNLGSGGFSGPRQKTPAPDGPQGQLYDLDADPGEQHNLYLERPDDVARLTALLGEIRADAGSPSTN